MGNALIVTRVFTARLDAHPKFFLVLFCCQKSPLFQCTDSEENRRNSRLGLCYLTRGPPLTSSCWQSAGSLLKMEFSGHIPHLRTTFYQRPQWFMCTQVLRSTISIPLPCKSVNPFIWNGKGPTLSMYWYWLYIARKDSETNLPSQLQRQMLIRKSINLQKLQFSHLHNSDNSNTYLTWACEPQTRSHM